MNDTRLLEMQARQMEGNPLSGPATLELEAARRGDSHMARLLCEDQELHADLLVLHRIEATGAEFAKRCMASQVETEPMATILAPGLEVASPLERLRRSKPNRKTKSFGRMWGGLAAATVLALVGFGTWMWYPRTADNSLSTAGSPNREVEPRNEQPSMIHDGVENHLAENEVESPAGEAVESESGTGVRTVRGLAGIRYTPESEWDRTPADEISFPAEYKLRSGIAELVLDDGTEMVFQGPAIMTLESPRRVRVDEGRFRIQPVAGETEFSISTPTVRLKGRDDMLAFIDVGTADGTVVQIERGELQARPWSNDHDEELSLAAGGMDRGIFGPAWQADSQQPATAVALNEKGEFNSLVDAAGRPLRVSSPTVFAQVLDTSREMIREDPKQFPQQWQGMMDNLESSATNTDLNINGQSVHPTSPAEMMEQFNRIREQMMKGMGQGADGNNSSAFSGALNVNGQEQRFTSPEEFFEAQQKMFGPMFGRMMGQMPNGKGVLGSGSQGMTGQLPETNNRPGLPSGNSNSASAFSGMINDNGLEMRFTMPEEFNRAMQQLRMGR